MQRVFRTSAVVTAIALLFQGFVPALAANGATVEGTVEIPCDPSRVREVAAVQIRPVAGGPLTTIPVDPSTGAFQRADLAAGEYELFTIGTDGQPISAEAKKLVLQEGVNKVALSFQPAGCGEPDPDPDAGDRPVPKDGLANWKLSLIYLGSVGAAVIVLNADGEDRASPTEPQPQP